MIVFAAVLLLVAGFFKLLDGIAAIANSHIFIGDAHFVVGDLRAWGWVMTIFGAAWLLASMTARLALAGDQPDGRMPEHPAQPPARHPYLIMNRNPATGRPRSPARHAAA